MYRTILRKGFFSAVLIIIVANTYAQNGLAEFYRAVLVRSDTNTVVFNIRTVKEGSVTIFQIINDKEIIKLTPEITADSVNFSMPVFESYFRCKRNADGSLEGIWTKGTAGEFQYWPFYAIPNQTYRFLKNQGAALFNISGRWDVTITRANGTLRKALAEFRQSGDKLSGTFLTPSGDYRYLEGIVTGDSLKLSTFDGAHVYTFYAKIENKNAIVGGVFYSGIAGKETWIANRNENIAAPEQEEPTRLREGESKLNFTFNDIDGKPVSIKDPRFKDKVVIIQIMGSWCPNCMDETKFLSEFYNKNRDRGVEVIGLAYEYSTDLDRSKKSLSKFKRLFDVQYPMLITGVTSTDEQKTEKTLPQLTPIRSFPTSIFLDKKGNVRDIHGVFYGPGTGQLFEQFKKEFNALVDKLLAE